MAIGSANAEQPQAIKRLLQRVFANRFVNHCNPFAVGDFATFGDEVFLCAHNRMNRYWILNFTVF